MERRKTMKKPKLVQWSLSLDDAVDKRLNKIVEQSPVYRTKTALVRQMIADSMLKIERGLSRKDHQ